MKKVDKKPMKVHIVKQIKEDYPWATEVEIKAIYKVRTTK